MKKIAVSILTALVITSSVVGYSKDLSDDLANDIVRVHIIAESNEACDQKVKYKVRDAILERMKAFEKKEDIEKSLEVFEKIANEVLEEEGFEYRARAEYGKFMFPTKHYDNFALPRGEYDAVRIRLGKAEGENWWCVLFPPLCMVDAATEESEMLLKEAFGENYEVVTGDALPVKIKFKLAEIF